MKNRKFYDKLKIKVADLLLEVGKTDELEFEKIFIDEEYFGGLDEYGISGEVYLQSVDKTTLLVKLKNIKCNIKHVCERCLAEYNYAVQIKEYVAKFVVGGIESLIDEEVDEIFEIDGEGYIDILPMIKNSILLQQPVDFKCEKCSLEVEKEFKEKGDERDKSDREGDNYRETNHINFTEVN